MESGLIKRLKINLWFNLILGILLLVIGIIIEANDIDVFGNNRILVALSFIPLGLFIASWIKIAQARKHPEKYADECDERLVIARYRADAISMRITRYLLWLMFLGYTFAKSNEVFESFAWWLLFGISMITVFLPIIFLSNVNKKYKPENAD